MPAKNPAENPADVPARRPAEPAPGAASDRTEQLLRLLWQPATGPDSGASTAPTSTASTGSTVPTGSTGPSGSATSAGNPRRTGRTDRKRRAGLTVDDFVDTGIALADAHGLAGLTMRAVAGRLGVGAMTLYGYVPGRAEGLALMIDRVHGTAYADPDELAAVAAADGWQAAAERLVLANWQLLQAHPWLIELPPGRPPIGPGTARKYEAELAGLAPSGLPPAELDRLLSTLLALVMQAARWEIGLARDRANTGLDDAGWWAQVGPVLAELAAGQRFPHAEAVGATMQSAGEPWQTLQFGVAAVCAGIGPRE